MAYGNKSWLEKQLKAAFANNSLLPSVRITEAHVAAGKGIDAVIDGHYASASRYFEEALKGAESVAEKSFLYIKLIECSKAIFSQTKSARLFRKICGCFKSLIETNETPDNYIRYIAFLGDELFRREGVALREEAIQVGKIALSKFPEIAELHVWMYRLNDWDCRHAEAYESMMKVCKLKYAEPVYLYNKFGSLLFERAIGSDDEGTIPISIILGVKNREIRESAGLQQQYALLMMHSKNSHKGLALDLLMDAYELNRFLPGLKEQMLAAYALAFNSEKDAQAKGEIKRKFEAFCEMHKISKGILAGHGSGALLPLAEAQKFPPAQKAQKQGLEAKVMLPVEIKKELDRYVIGQEEPKKAVAVALYTHLLRIERKAKLGLNDIEKSNVLLLGPTGCGKTYIAQVLARIAKVPFVICDTSKVTSAGYVGSNAEDCLAMLLNAAGGNLELAQTGIVYLDEADKIKMSRGVGKDVGGEGAQQQYLKLLEGSVVNVAVGEGNQKMAIPFDTTSVMFIVGGAFSDTSADESLGARIAGRTGVSSIGFKSGEKDIDLQAGFGKVLRKLTDRDLQEYGFLPEFAGRLQNRIVLGNLSKDELRRILVEPVDAILPQYEKIFGASGIKLKIAPEALDAIAEEAFRLKAGARSFKTICDSMFIEPLFSMPGTAVKELKVDKAFVAAVLSAGRH